MSLRYRTVVSILVGGLLSLVAHGAEPVGGLIQYPAISPDASKIVFSAAGDLWSVPVSGGAAYRLTSHPGNDTRSRFNSDGSMLVFESDRDGAQNLYTLGMSESRGFLVGGELNRVTISDRAEQLGGFSADGTSVMFSAYMYPQIYRQPRMYSVPLAGGAITRITDAFGRAPSLGADGEGIYFMRGYYYPHRVAYRGPGNIDIWRFDPGDNTFTQVTAFTGNDMDPNPLPDGSLVYLSSRDGQYNLVHLAPGATDQDGSAVTQLTHFKPDAVHPTTIAHGVRDLQVSGDGSTAVFVVWNTLYTLDLTNPRATPRAVDVTVGADLSRDREYRKDLSREVSEAAVHPSGKAVAQIARGELFIRSTQEGFPTYRVTDTSARERDIAWSPDGVKLYFVADDDQSLGSIYAATVALTRGDLDPQPEPKDEPEAEAQEPTDDRAGDAPAADDQEARADNGGDEPGAGEPEGEDQEKKTDEKKGPEIDYAKRWADALRFTIEPVVRSDELVFHPVPSPNGKKLMYLRQRGDIVIRDLATGEDRVISRQWSEPDIIWASDSRHIIYAAADLDFNADIFLLDTMPDGEGNLPKPINITRHPDIDHSPRLSHDGKVLTFLSDRDNENGDWDVYAVYLDRELEGLADYELSQYYKDATEKAAKLKPIEPIAVGGQDTEIPPETGGQENEPGKEGAASGEGGEQDTGLKFDTSDAYMRIRRLTSTPQAESDLVMTPGGDRIIFSTVIDTDRSFVSVDYKGKDRKTITAGGVGDPRVSLDGKSLSFISSGQAATSSPTGGKVEKLPIDATITIDRDLELAQKFREAAGRFGMNFYHPTLKGLDWDAVTERYRQLVMQTRTNDAFLRLMNLMWGEVDGSHTGTWGGDGYSAPSPGNGYLGINFTPIESGYRIDSIIEGGPIDRMKNGPRIGDVIVAIGDKRLIGAPTPSGLVSLHEAMANMARSEQVIEFITSDEPGVSTTRYALVTPDSYSTMSVLRYQDEVAKRRARVEALSDGRLGYLHIRAMGLAQVRDYERDLFAAADGKEGLIIDVRDNGGGWTADILLASLTAPNHAYTVPRGADPEQVRNDNYPRDRRLIYPYTRPINVLINENSFSNAEIFAHAIKTIGRGPLIGTQTFGGVISTGSFRLIDGTTVRRPFRGWYLPDGTDMEQHGAMPDIEVPQTPGDEAAGDDPQLEAAVKELMERIGG